MTIQFYYTNGGPFAWRCLLALAIKQVEYIPVILDLSRGDTRTAEFLQLNPRGTLPVLRDGEIVVRESQAIVYYLDRAYPEPALYGRTPAEAARIMQEICEQGSYLEAHLRKVVGQLLFKAGDASGIADVVEPLLNELELLNSQLGNTVWIAGNEISAADLNIYPFLASLERALLQPAAANLKLRFQQNDARFSNISRWMRAVQELAGYTETVPRVL